MYHEKTALDVLKRVNPGRFGVCLYVNHLGAGAAEFIIWTRSDGRMHEHRLDAASTSAERLEAHLRAFCENFQSSVI